MGMKSMPLFEKKKKPCNNNLVAILRCDSYRLGKALDPQQVT